MSAPGVPLPVPDAPPPPARPVAPTSIRARALSAFVRDWPGLAVATLIVELFTLGSSALVGAVQDVPGPLPIVLIAALTLAAFGLEIGLLRLFLASVLGRRLDTGELLEPFRRPVALGGYLLAAVALLAGAFGVITLVHGATRAVASGVASWVVGSLALGLGIWLLPPLVLGAFALAQGTMGLREAGVDAWRVARGARLLVMGLLAVALVLRIMGVLLAGVGLVVTVPLGGLLLASAYVEGRAGAGRPSLRWPAPPPPPR